MRKILILIVHFVYFTSSAQIVINEYSAANYDTYTDNYGEYEDWVELYNPTASAVDINGWGLSDKVSNPLKWIIPSSFIVPAGGTAIIYCSGRDEIIGLNAHSNFKITQTKGNEVFMLSDAAGILQDSIRVYANQNSHTRGREVDGSAIWSVFVNGTPGGNNVGAMQEYATTPIFSLVGGYYSMAINISLTSPDPSTTIYYTTNGDEPNNTSTQYNGTSINISTTTVVKAICYSSDPTIPSSFIDYHTFFINDAHTIPILSISGDQVDNLLNGNQIEPEGTIEWFDKNCILLDKGTGEFNKHGNDSWAYAQRGFDYVMRDQFGYNYALQDKVFMTKDRDKFQRVIVKSAANDNYPFSYGSSGAHIRDAYVHHLSQLADLRMDERSTTSCILYLNGAYWGVYEMREKVDDHDFTDHYYDQDKNNLQYLKTWGGTWTEYGAPNAQPDWDNFVDYVDNNPMSVQANYLQAKGEYNTGSLIDYFLLNAYVVCQDWLNWNTAWWRGMDPNGEKKKWRYTLWDMDNTFDHGANYTGIPSSEPDASPCDPSTLDNGSTNAQGHVSIWNEMLTNQEFHDDYINRWQDLANGGLSCDFMIYVLDSMVAVIDPEMPRQIATWGGTYAAWQSNVADLRDFILARCDSMNAGFVDCDTSITGIFDVTVEIVGVGEVEMSNNNIINPLNSGWTDQRFGGIDLPFKVVSGAFDHWEIISTTAYVYDPNVDTLVLDLQGDVVVRAYFGEMRDIVFDIDPNSTTSSIDINGTVINTFPYSDSFLVGGNVSLTPDIDALYGFDSWSSDSNFLSPSPLTENINLAVAYADTIMLHLYQKPTIFYQVLPAGTATSISANGFLLNSFPDSIDYFIDEVVNLSSIIDTDYEFISWSSSFHNILPSPTSLLPYFQVEVTDTITLNLSKKPEITYIVDPPLTSSTITVDGVVIPAVDFPKTIFYPTNQLINISANPDTDYGFEYWHADSVILMPSVDSSTASFLASNNSTVTLHVYKKPTITYIVDPPGTTTSIDINGVNRSIFPYSEKVFIDDLNTINPIIDPLFSFSSWEKDSNNLLNGSIASNSFYGLYNDTITLRISEVSAFINSVNNSICDNDTVSAEVLVSFLFGTPPYTFGYQIDGVNQPQITTENNPHIIHTRKGGIYTLSSFSDVNISGNVNGSALVTVLESPTADFNAYPDTLTILNTTVGLTDKSTSDENLISWEWNFGDYTALDNSQNPYHTYSTTTGLYNVSLIVSDDVGCSDTTSRIITITDDYWMWVPNSFTPDMDGINDKFCIAYNGIKDKTFTFNVFDRFSNLVYSTNNIDDLGCENGWDGRHQKTGNELPMGVYIYKIYYQDFDGWKHQEIKELILVR